MKVLSEGVVITVTKHYQGNSMDDPSAYEIICIACDSTITNAHIQLRRAFDSSLARLRENYIVQTYINGVEQR